MKRSEMVERIYDLLNCDGVLEYSMPKLEPVPLTEEHVRWVAKQIVQEIEQAGMLPPETKATPSDLSNTGFTQEFLDEHNFSVNKWESEDEE
jgi:hypothetical protein